MTPNRQPGRVPRNKRPAAQSHPESDVQLDDDYDYGASAIHAEAERAADAAYERDMAPYHAAATRRAAADVRSRAYVDERGNMEPDAAADANWLDALADHLAAQAEAEHQGHEQPRGFGR